MGIRRSMKLVWTLLVAGLTLGGACVSGCASMYDNGPRAHSGYRIGWEVQRPPLVISGPNVTAVTSSGSQASSAGLVGIDQASTLNAMSTPAPAEVPPAATVEGRYRGGRVRSVTAVPAYPSECTAQDLCDRLDRIERRIAAQPPPPPAAVPQGGSPLPPVRMP